MARKAIGIDQLALARELLKTAKTADELRKAQVVSLPLELGLSLEETAKPLVDQLDQPVVSHPVL